MKFLNNQNEISKKHRAILICWLLDVADDYKLSFDSFHVSVVLIDRYLSKTTVKKSDFQAVGIICLHIASKIREDNINKLDISECIYISDNTYDIKTLINIEKDILEKLNYNVYVSHVHKYLHQLFITNKIESLIYYQSTYISCMLILSTNYICFDPKQIADKIINFINILNNDKFTDIVNNDPIYALICRIFHLHESYPNNTIYKLFNLEKYKFVAKTIIMPKFEIKKIPYDKLFYQSFETPCLKYYEKFHLDHILGRGTYGSVHNADVNGKRIALKSMNCLENNGGIESSAIIEINTLLSLSHKNIVKLEGIALVPEKINPYIGLELLDKTLYERIKYVGLSTKQKMLYIQDLLNGLSYMHSQNIIHTDISIVNLMISNDNVLKICDFGTSVRFEENDWWIRNPTYISTLTYRSIELLMNAPYYNSKIDVWSAACVIVFILTKNFLWNGDSEADQLGKIVGSLGGESINNDPELKDWEYYGRDKPFMRCEKKGFPDLEKNYNSATSILYQMLQYNPNKRISASEALSQFKLIKIE